MTSQPLLSIRGLKTYFHTTQGLLRAVDGVDLDVYRGELLGIVGESGSGKTMTAFSLMGLVPAPPGRRHPSFCQEMNPRPARRSLACT